MTKENLIIHVLQHFFCALIICIAVTAFTGYGCWVPDTPDNETVITPLDDLSLPARGFFMGILPIPSEEQSLVQSYAQAAQHAECAPVWSGGLGARGFWDYAESLAGGTGDLVVNSLIRSNGMFPIINFSFIDRDPATGLLIVKRPPDLPDATLSHTRWRQAYRDAVLDVVRTIRPRYISLGNEVNRWYEHYGADPENPDSFLHFVSLYEQLYDAVKKLSPQSYVFCIFSREVVAELREADLSVLQLFDPDKLDVIVCTSYPNSVRTNPSGGALQEPFNSPADIPDDYYSRIMSCFPDKPFGFSEVAWPSSEFFGGEQAQADFITAVSGRLTRGQGMSLHLLGWPWLHDLDENDTTGLIMRSGDEKEGYRVWKEISNATSNLLH